MVIPVVNADFLSGPASRPNPANDRAAKPSVLCVLLPRIDGATFPKLARYQLRYTRIVKFNEVVRVHAAWFPLEDLGGAIIPDFLALCKGVWYDTQEKQMR